MSQTFQDDMDDGLDSDCSMSSNSGKQVTVGICAMAKKSGSKPMKEILMRLQEFEYLKMIVFQEEVILKVISKENQPY
jgi:inositol-hexakisphosphate/diphosphoinositol-pentakisphosphate 1-kinase